MKRHTNLTVTEQALNLLRTSPHFGDNSELPDSVEVTIPCVTWHALGMTQQANGSYRVTVGPHYNLSYIFLSECHSSPGIRIFAVENCLVAVQLAPYLDFDESIQLEMDYVNQNIIIYPADMLSLAAQAHRGIGL